MFTSYISLDNCFKRIKPKTEYHCIIVQHAILCKCSCAFSHCSMAEKRHHLEAIR